MTQRIALFNHKGGVSKTTTTFNLGWMLAEKGKRVILVDADPQCNLTGLVLGYGGPNTLENFYQQESKRNLKDGLAPAFESRPEPLKAVDCVPVTGRDGLFMLPGHIGLSEYEVTLGIAQELSGSIQTLQNLPGSITRLLELTAEKHEADYMLIDLNPSLSSINQNLLMTSQCFIVPANPDYFSAMAIQSLSRVLPDWRKWAKRASDLPVLQQAVYPFPNVTPKFLGAIVQNYRPIGGSPASAFQTWIDKINKNVSEELFPELTKMDMTLSQSIYENHGVGGFCLATIPDFNSLIAKSQEYQTPVYVLDDEQLGPTGGIVRDRTAQSRDNFREIFSDLADKVVSLVNYASSP